MFALARQNPFQFVHSSVFRLTDSGVCQHVSEQGAEIFVDVGVVCLLVIGFDFDEIVAGAVYCFAVLINALDLCEFFGLLVRYRCADN